MGIESLFNTTCTTQYNATSATGKSGGAPSWTTRASGVPCRIQVNGAVEPEAPEGVAIAAVVGFFPAGTVLGEADRVVADGVTYLVEGVNALPGGMAHHVECALKEVR